MLLLLGEIIHNEVISAVTEPLTGVAKRLRWNFYVWTMFLPTLTRQTLKPSQVSFWKSLKKTTSILTGFKVVLDEANVVGERPGVATRLQANARIRSLISVHFVCHKLALKISASATIKQMQNTLNTLWQLLENSNKKTAIFMKVQLQMNEITLTNKNAKKKIAK